MKKILSLILALTMIFTLAACSGGNETPAADGQATETPAATAEEPIILKVAATVPDASPSGEALLNVFKPAVEEKTGGRVIVEVYNNAVLGGDRQLAEALQLGTLEAHAAPLSVLANFVPAFNASELPFLYKDKAIAYAALDGEWGEMMAKDLPSQGMRLLSYWENSFRNVSTVNKEIKTLEDMKGLKMRVMESPIYISMFKALGSNPTPVAFSELYTALSQGTVEGHDNGVVLAYASKLYETTDYYLISEQNYAAAAMVVSEEWWQGLDEDIQQAIIEASNESRDWQRENNSKAEIENLELIKEAGVKVSILSDAEKERWKEATKVVYDEMEALAGKEIIDAARQVDEKYGK